PKFEFAVNLLDGNKLTLAELDKIPLGDERLQHLGCPECKCLLTFNHSGVNNPSLSTRNGVDHVPGCPYAVKRTSGKKVTYVGNEVSLLTSTELIDRAHESYYEYMRKYKSEHGIQVKRRKRKSSENNSTSYIGNKDE